MALKKLRMICAGGDKTLAEWDTETVNAQRLAEIEKEFNEKVAQGWFAADISGKRGNYVISPYSQTEIRDASSGRCVAYACLQLSIPAPTYDRMVAEYLLIKNAEDVYWKTANIFSRSGNEFGIATLFLIAFDIALFVNLLLEVLTVH